MDKAQANYYFKYTETNDMHILNRGYFSPKNSSCLPSSPLGKSEKLCVEYRKFIKIFLSFPELCISTKA